MFWHNYTKRYNKLVRCLHLILCNKFKINKTNKLIMYSVIEEITNENVKIRLILGLNRDFDKD